MPTGRNSRTGGRQHTFRHFLGRGMGFPSILVEILRGTEMAPKGYRTVSTWSALWRRNLRILRRAMGMLACKPQTVRALGNIPASKRRFVSACWQGALKPGWSASPKGSHGKRRITVCLLAYVKYEHSVSWLMAYVNNRYFPVRLVYPAGGFSSEAIARRCVAWFVAIA